MLLIALRITVRIPDGGIHHIFGGGVPITRICFKTESVFCRNSDCSICRFLFVFKVPSKNATISIFAELKATDNN